MLARRALVLSAFVLATGAIDALAPDRLEAQPFVGSRFGGPLNFFATQRNFVGNNFYTNTFDVKASEPART